MANFYTVSGDITPIEAKGNYTYAGNYDDLSYYLNANGYAILWLGDAQTYQIVKFNQFNIFWVKEPPSDIITGTYHYSTDTTGIATVSGPFSSEESSEDYSFDLEKNMAKAKKASFSERMQYPWEVAGVITSAQSALTGTQRNNASVVALAAAKKIIHQPEAGAVGLEFRFRADGSENDAPVLEVYKASGVDFYTRIATLTLSRGTQFHSTGIYFADTITETNQIPGTKVSQPSTPDNHIATWVINTDGGDRFLFIASTLVVTSIYVDVRRL